MGEKCIAKKVTSNLEVLKSRFIAICFYCDNVTKFKDELEKAKKEYPKAKHYVYAYKIGTSTKSCDDNEPKGSAGRPILEIILKKGLNNIGIIVVRYFGGKLLGSGRLLRTYVKSVSDALSLCEIVEK